VSAFATVDPVIQAWIKRHGLPAPYTSWAGDEIRAVYLSSAAGECFQIWITPPADGLISISAACVEGRNDTGEPQRWSVAVEDLDAGLETAVKTVIAWMAPSVRYVPSGNGG
jgi:hypothetical protein